MLLLAVFFGKTRLIDNIRLAGDAASRFGNGLRSKSA